MGARHEGGGKWMVTQADGSARAALPAMPRATSPARAWRTHRYNSATREGARALAGRHVDTSTAAGSAMPTANIVQSENTRPDNRTKDSQPRLAKTEVVTITPRRRHALGPRRAAAKSTAKACY